MGHDLQDFYGAPSLGGHAPFSGSHLAGQTPLLAKGTDKKVLLFAFQSGRHGSVPEARGVFFPTGALRSAVAVE